MSSAPTAREASKQATRDALIAAAALEYAEQGLEGASLNAICARAGFTRGAFYVHFRDREDLLVSVMDRILGGFVETLTAASEADAAGGDLERIVMTIAFALAANTTPLRGTKALRFHHVLGACDLAPVVQARYVNLLNQVSLGVARAVVAGQRAGTVRMDVDAETLAKMLVINTLGLIAASEVAMPVDPSAIAKTLLRMIAPAPEPIRAPSST